MTIARAALLLLLSASNAAAQGAETGEFRLEQHGTTVAIETFSRSADSLVIQRR